MTSVPRIHRGYADVDGGQVHYALCGPRDAPPVLLLHQTPRSWREFAGVLPLLGARYDAIAMDTVGFGDSMPPPWPPSMERWAETAGALLEALGRPVAAVVGHHTGGNIAIEMAARFGTRIAGLVLSSASFIDEAGRRMRHDWPPIDLVAPSTDGSHLQALWRRREPFYPPGRPDLLEAYVVDALRAHGNAEVGHEVCARYRMEDRIGLVTQPVRVIRATADPYAAPEAEALRARLPQAVCVDIEGGMVPLPDQMPEAFAAAVLAFLDTLPRDGGAWRPAA